MINKHKPIERLSNNNTDTDNNTDNNNNNNNNNSNNNTDNNNNNNNNNEHGEWKIMLRMYINCISTKSFNGTHTMHPKSKQVEVYMGSDAESVINTLLQNFHRIQETSNERGSEFIPDSVELLEYEFHKMDIITAEPYIITPDWIASKKATINPNYEKDHKFFQWSIIAALNYNNMKEKELKKLLKSRRVDTNFSSHQRDWGNFEQENNSIALNVLFVSHNSEEMKLAYKSIYNRCKNQVILLIINDEANNYYYFTIKNLSELNSLGWLQSKKEAIINNNNTNNNNNDF